MSTTGYPRVDRALGYYYAVASNFQGFPFASLDELIEKISAPGMSFPRNFDAAMNDAQMTEPHLKVAMESVGMEEKGNFQYVMDQMFQALIRDVTSLTKISSQAYDAIAVDVKEVSDAAVSASKTLLSYGPYLIAGALALYALIWFTRLTPKRSNPRKHRNMARPETQREIEARLKKEVKGVIAELKHRYGYHVADYDVKNSGRVILLNKRGSPCGETNTGEIDRIMDGLVTDRIAGLTG